MKKTVSAIFETNHAANRAMDRLLAADFDRDDISLLMSRDTRLNYYPEEPSAEGTAWGAGIGAIVGGLLGIAAATPGGIFVAGPLAGFFGGAALGAASGGLMGALVDIGIPEERARVYVERIENGGILVAVDAENTARASEAERILLEAGGPLPRQTMQTTKRASL